jgi:hypothetical protein
MKAPSAWQRAQAARQRAAGDRKRRVILRRLAAGPARNAEFAALLRVSLTSVRWHLRILRAQKRIRPAGWLAAPSGRDCVAWALAEP